MNFVISIFLGLLPEVLYFTLFLVYTKNLKEKRLKLFLLLAIGYIALIMMCRFQFLFYITYIIYSYLVLKLLYKSHIIDLFVCSLGLMYMTLVAFIGFKILGKNYVAYYIVARIVLYLPFIFRKKFGLIYKNYRKLWNRNDDAKIKSLTIRNMSLIGLNIFILLINLCAILCSLYYLSIK